MDDDGVDWLLGEIRGLKDDAAFVHCARLGAAAMGSRVWRPLDSESAGVRDLNRSSAPPGIRRYRQRPERGVLYF